jgi:16S rRNA processing protein RimM
LTDNQAKRGPRRPRRTSPQSSSNQQSESTSASSQPTGRKRPIRRPSRPAQGAPLVDTAGPDPATPPEETRLAIGVIVGTHGLRGEAKLRLSTDDPERLTKVKRIYIGDDETPRRLRGVRFHGGLALLQIAGVDNPEAADTLRGETIRISGKDVRPLEAGEFFLYQLVGLAAYDEDGQKLGTLVDIIETGTNDVLVIKSDAGDELLVPNHPDFVPAIEPEKGRLTVRPPVYYS